jgi:hypothetical protein
MDREEEAFLFLAKRIKYYSAVEAASAKTGNVVVLATYRVRHNFDRLELDLLEQLTAAYGCSEQVAIWALVETLRQFHDLLLLDS